MSSSEPDGSPRKVSVTDCLSTRSSCVRVVGRLPQDPVNAQPRDTLKFVRARTYVLTTITQETPNNTYEVRRYPRISPTLSFQENSFVSSLLDISVKPFQLAQRASALNYQSCRGQTPLRMLPSAAIKAISNASSRSINVNDPSLITLVNKLQDVFTTVGVSRSLSAQIFKQGAYMIVAGPKSDRLTSNCCGRITVKWQEFCTRKYCRKRFVG
jgi:hypothetical protein